MAIDPVSLSRLFETLGYGSGAWNAAMAVSEAGPMARDVLGAAMRKPLMEQEWNLNQENANAKRYVADTAYAAELEKARFAAKLKAWQQLQQQAMSAQQLQMQYDRMEGMDQRQQKRLAQQETNAERRFDVTEKRLAQQDATTNRRLDQQLQMQQAELAYRKSAAEQAEDLKRELHAARMAAQLGPATKLSPMMEQILYQEAKEKFRQDPTQALNYMQRRRSELERPGTLGRDTVGQSYEPKPMRPGIKPGQVPTSLQQREYKRQADIRETGAGTLRSLAFPAASAAIGPIPIRAGAILGTGAGVLADWLGLWR